METMTSDSVLRALRIAGWQTGNAQIRIVHCDRGSNLLPLADLENENAGNEEEVKVFDDLKRTLHRNGIILKPATAKSPWRLALVEKCQHLFKMALKRCGYFFKKFSLSQWSYIAHRMASQVNARALNVSYQDDSFITISPSTLLFGMRKADFPRDIDLDGKDEKLFQNVKKIDKECLLLENAWYKSYYHSLRKWRKWQVRKTLSPDDCVMILDRISPNGIPQLGLVTKMFSDRTFEISYVVKQAQIDKKTFKITKSAKKGTLTRPINQLAIICGKNECENISLEFVDVDKTKTIGSNHLVEDEFLGVDETFNDEHAEEVIKDNLEGMIVDTGNQPVEVVDEIHQEGQEENVNDPIAETAEDQEEAVVVDKAEYETGDQASSQNQGTNDDDTVNKVQRKQPIILNVEDEETEEIVDATTPKPTKAASKTKTKPKGRKKRKKMNW